MLRRLPRLRGGDEINEVANETEMYPVDARVAVHDLEWYTHTQGDRLRRQLFE